MDLMKEKLNLLYPENYDSRLIISSLGKKYDPLLSLMLIYLQR